MSTTLRPRSPHYTSVTSAQPIHDKDIARERLAADLAAFDRAGGQIEVLGITPLRRKEPKPEAPVKNHVAAKKPV